MMPIYLKGKPMKMIAKLGLASLSALVLLTGCGDKEPTPAPQEEVYVNPELQGAPKWVMVPYVEGTIAAVGSEKPNAGNDIGYQRELAILNARTNLQKILKTKVSSLVKSYKAATGAGKAATYDNSSESTAEEIATGVLNGSRVHDTWMSRTGTLYVLMVLDTQGVQQAFDEKVIKTSFGNDNAKYQKFLASEAHKELQQRLQTLEQ
jgi:hypothetical protein